MKELILEQLKRKGQLSFLQLARLLNIKRFDNKKLSHNISKLISLCKISEDINGNFFIIKEISRHTGFYKSSNKNFGFLDLDNKSIFIHKKNSRNALNNDKIEVIEFLIPNSNKEQGIVTKIINRNRKSLVGIVLSEKGKPKFIPINNIENANFKFNNEEFKLNHIYKVEIIESNYDTTLIIKPLKCLGHKNDNNINVESTIASWDIDHNFSKLIFDELKEIPSIVSESNIQDRIDFRKKLTFTIDGIDSKDFDDAISIEKDNDNYRLFVHIADVSHYIKKDSHLDKEAFNRGTSIYLVDRVIPMLPKQISNGICSLNPNVDRLAITCEMLIDKDGKTISTKFYESIINSDFRLTYNFVNSFFANEDVTIDSELAKSLLHAKDLSSLIRNNKKEMGYVDFEISEILVKLDKDKLPIDIYKKESGLAEKMIEDFMVKANEAIANFIESKSLPFIYRIHDAPSSDKFESLQKILNILRINYKVSYSSDPIQFSNLINNIKEHRFDDFIKISLLRTMSKAKYSSNNIGHYGLASNSYTHFTSPIRRYPDLIVHRILRELIFKNNMGLQDYFSKNLDKIAENCSLSEVKAMDLERKILDLKKAEYYEKYIEKKLSGQIVSILNFGIFVEIEGKASGLIHKSSMPSNVVLEPDKMHIIYNNKLIKIGSTINIRIKSVDKMLGKIDLELL